MILRTALLASTTLALVAGVTSAWSASLFDVNQFTAITADPRASKVGDQVTVLIVEAATAESRSDTSSNAGFGVDAGLTDGSGLSRVGASIETDSAGAARTARVGRIQGQLSAFVERATPSGGLLIRGRQEIVINGELQQISVEGVIRPEDVSAENTVLSTRLADALIRFNGEGWVSDGQRPGLFRRFFHFLGFQGMRKLAALFVGMLFVQIPAFAAKQDGALFQESSPVRIKELVRIQGARENPVVGYGLVVGLAGTGDGPRSRATMQSLGNALQRFGVHVGDAQITSRNVAAVMVTGSLPPHANPGDKLDISVSCIGDARSLVGGTLLLTPLQGADDQTYVLAQGPVMVGGYRYDAFGNLLQKNHPTVGTVSEGGLVEATSPSSVMSASGAIHLLLHSPDYTTASRIAQALAAEFGQARLGADIIAEGPSRVTFRLNDGERQRLVDVLGQVESLSVTPDLLARVVVNERTGTIVSGGNVRLGAVSITQGNLSVSIETDFRVSQPSLLVDPGNAIRSVVVPDTRIEALEAEAATVVLASGANVSELATALGGIKATPREVISILQAIQRAGALHAELIVQ